MYTYMYLVEISSSVTSKSRSEDRNEVTINQRSYTDGFRDALPQNPTYQFARSNIFFFPFDSNDIAMFVHQVNIIKVDYYCTHSRNSTNTARSFTISGLYKDSLYF